MPARVWTAAALLVLTAVFLHSHAVRENTPSREGLASFPRELGPWSGTDLSIPDDVRAVLGQGDLLNRTYISADGSSVELFIAYFSSQRTGDTIHSPKNCLPGAGWTPLSVGHATLRGVDQRPIEVNEYIVGKGEQRQLVFYWYQAHGRVTESEYWAKWYLISDSIKLHRSDGALVRIVTPIGEDERKKTAQQRAAHFGEEILPLLDTFIPR